MIAENDDANTLLGNKIVNIYGLTCIIYMATCVNADKTDLKTILKTAWAVQEVTH